MEVATVEHDAVCHHDGRPTLALQVDPLPLHRAEGAEGRGPAAQGGCRGSPQWGAGGFPQLGRRREQREQVRGRSAAAHRRQAGGQGQAEAWLGGVGSWGGARGSPGLDVQQGLGGGAEGSEELRAPPGQLAVVVLLRLLGPPSPGSGPARAKLPHRCSSGSVAPSASSSAGRGEAACVGVAGEAKGPPSGWAMLSVLDSGAGRVVGWWGCCWSASADACCAGGAGRAWPAPAGQKRKHEGRVYRGGRCMPGTLIEDTPELS